MSDFLNLSLKYSAKTELFLNLNSNWPGLKLQTSQQTED